MPKTAEQIAVNTLNPFEKDINQYKDFFKKYLKQIRNKKLAIEDVMSLLPLYHTTPSFTSILAMTDETSNLITATSNVLNKHFSEEYISLFNKSVERKPSKEINDLGKSFDESIFIGILSSFKASMDQIRDQNRRQWEYKKRMLNFTYNCLVAGGLHPKIADRNEQKFKLFNFVVKHKHHSRVIIEEYKSLIPWKEFHENYLNYYNNRKPIKINGKIIPFEKIVQIKITTTLLLDDERELFLRKHNAIGDAKTNEENFIRLCKDETDRFHYNPFEAELKPKEVTTYRDTQIALIKFPSALKLLNDAISKIDNDTLARNCLDDLRLCLEVFFKEKMKNTKTLENQKPILGKYIKEKGGSNEIVGLFQRILEFYANYQNSNIKHHDKAKPQELKLIFNITSSLIIHVSEL